MESPRPSIPTANEALQTMFIGVAAPAESAPVTDPLNTDTLEMPQPPEWETAEIPEITPVFLGLRKYVTELRLYRAETILETGRRESVAHHVGELVGKPKAAWSGYSKEDDPLRPVTRHEIRSARKLELAAEKARTRGLRSNHLKMAYGVTRSEEANTLFKARNNEAPRPRKEKRHLAKNDRKIRRLDNGILGTRFLGRQGQINKFNRISSSNDLRSRYAKSRVARAQKRGNKLAGKLSSIEMSQEQKRIDKQNRRIDNSATYKPSVMGTADRPFDQDLLTPWED